MNEHPILFTGQMVKAIKDNHKTVTRRVIKPQPINKGEYWSWKKSEKDWFAGVTYKQLISDKGLLYPKRTPYHIGDLLWVRESWWDLGYMENGKWNGRLKNHTVGPRYVASCPDPYVGGIGGIIQPKKIPWRNSRFMNSTWRKRPSIHMPKWAARLWLKIVDIRAERLQEITEDEIFAEGLCPTSLELAYLEWIDLWNSINAKRGYPWSSNPWVWRIEFKFKEKQWLKNT